MGMGMAVEVASLPAQCQQLCSPKATSKISSSAAMLRIYNACNGTYYFICYVAPPSLLHAVCVVRVWQQLSATRSCRNSSQRGQGRPSKAKASQAKTGQASRRQFQPRRLWHILVMCFSCPCPCLRLPPIRRQATSGSQHRSRLS